MNCKRPVLLTAHSLDGTTDVVLEIQPNASYPGILPGLAPGYRLLLAVRVLALQSLGGYFREGEKETVRSRVSVWPDPQEIFCADYAPGIRVEHVQYDNHKLTIDFSDGTRFEPPAHELYQLAVLKGYMP